MTILADTVSDLLQTVEQSGKRLQSISEEAASLKPAPEKWSRKEILGHLIDSAANNHQRFVRVRQVQSLAFPEYQQNEWAAAQACNDRPWLELIEFWRLYNRHLAHIIRLMPDEMLNRTVAIGPKEPIAVRRLLESYMEHLKHHLEQM